MACVICCKLIGQINLDRIKVTNEFCEIFNFDSSSYIKEFLEFCIDCSNDLSYIYGILLQIKLFQKELQDFRQKVKDKTQSFPNSNSGFCQIVQNIRREICKGLSLPFENLEINGYETDSLNYQNTEIKTENEILIEDDFESINSQYQYDDYLSDSNEYSKSTNEVSTTKSLKLEALRNKSVLRIKKLEDMSSEEIKIEMSPLSGSDLERNCESVDQGVEPKAKRKVHRRKDIHSIKPDLDLQIYPESQLKNTCEACKITFNNKSEFLAHCLEIHRNKIVKCSSKIVCQICGKSVKDIARHILVHDEQTVKCEICLKTLKNKATLEIHHKKVHVEEEKIVCPTCGKNYNNMPSLVAHEKLVHPKNIRFTCDVCQKGFEYLNHLQSHQICHEPPSIKCLHPGCDSIFKRKSHLVYHMRKHTGERPYKCETCGKGFRSITCKKVHETLHTNIFRAECEICGKKYTHPTYLRAHQTWHKKVKSKGNGTSRQRSKKTKN